VSAFQFYEILNHSLDVLLMAGVAARDGDWGKAQRLNKAAERLQKYLRERNRIASAEPTPGLTGT